jgi:hypothetical protein
MLGTALAACVSLCFGVRLTAPLRAAASEAKPFGVSVTMQTTGPTKQELLAETSAYNIYEFTNEPEPYTQAGGHPWALTTTVEFASEELEDREKGHELVPTRDPRDIVVNLPPGLLGDPMAVPRCSLATVFNGARCPASTQVGVYRIRWFGGKEALYPIVNVVPERGQSAEFAFENNIKINPVLTGHLVRTKEGYGFSVVSSNIPQVEFSRVEATFWGVPADPSHDAMRGLYCANEAAQVKRGPIHCTNTSGNGGEPAGVSPTPFLTLPTDCAAGPETGTVRTDSWQEPSNVLTTTVTMPAVTGCDLLTFGPTIEMQPDTELADEPVGLGVNLRVPLNERPASNATPQLRDSVVTLPEGLSVSPGVVDGIQACNEFGPEGINITAPPSGPDLSEEAGLSGELQLAAGHCPDASIVGTAEAFTPFLPVPVKGHIYLARPGCGGAGEPACTEHDALDGKLYRLYLELGGTGELAETGVHFKVPFETEANPATGQLTANVREVVQAPFSELKVHLNGGPRAPLANPAACGPALTTADFTPWSAPGTTPQGSSVAGTPDATPSSFFNVVGCPRGPPLAPGFSAGTVTPLAGRFSAFTLNLSRQDREQYVKGIQVHTPPGLLGMLSSVPLCGAVEADAGTCPEASKIGTTRVASGAGSHPFEIGGSVYLTGPYNGAPFGLSVVTHVVAGPFNLGIVVVRARINVDPDTSTLTVTTDETGPHAIPQVFFGVPLRLQRVTVDIERPNFMFNPTNCRAQQVSAIISGSQNAIANVASTFAVGGCKSLAFKPKFTVSTNGHTSRTNGASLDTKLSYPAGSVGSEANIAHVKVSLPRRLPSRLTTLQKACPAAIFNANAAACPSGSIVGIVRATTPVLPVELAGPVYFVSHGGEAFPSLIVVLQGYGVRVDLTGTTFISKAGITSSTFKTVPDVPVKTFELYLPQGRNSALAANGNLCKAKAGQLVMPTEFVAQNGAVFKQSTKIQVTGCRSTRGKTARTKRRGAR